MSTPAAPDRAGTPRLVVVTDARVAAGAGRDVVAQVSDAIAAGAPAVWLRDRALPPDERRALGERVAALVHAAGATLWVSASDPADVALGRELGADAVHLPAAAPLDLVAPQAGAAPLRVGRSCHDPGEVADAAAAGLDHVVVAPAAPTATKPGHGPALGPEGVAALVRAAGALPAIALGGVTAELVGPLRAAGAHGVAVLGSVMRAADPGAVVTALLAALDHPREPAR